MGRAQNLNNMIDEYQESFDQAEKCLGASKNNNISYAKFLTIKAIASKKRDSNEIVEENFNEALRVYIAILGTKDNYLVYNIIFEMGELCRK